MYKIEKEAFEFELDGKVHSVDPWGAYKALYLEEDITVFLEDAESEALSDSARREALDKAISMVREAFSIAEVDAGSCVQVLQAFAEFVEEAKKKRHGWLTLLQTLAWDSLAIPVASQTGSDSESQSSEEE